MRKFKVVVSGKSYEVEIEELSGDSLGSAQSAPQAIQAPQPAAKPVGNGTELKSPMPGSVIDLKVANGAAVKKGDVILVLEAMKMENDISAPADGVVTFSISKGATVNTGDLLAVVG